MADRYETAFRRYVVENAKCEDVARELGTSTASVIRWSRKWEKDHPAQAHELRRAASANEPPKPVGFMAVVAARVAAEPKPPPPSPVPKASTKGDPTDGDDEDEAPAELPPDADALTIVKHQIRELRRYIEAARKSGNIETVQRFTRSIVELVNAQRQLEKAQRLDDGVIVASAAEIDDAIKSIDEKVQAVAPEPLVCSDCGRKMRRRKAGA
jgi:hypothetical protein